MTVRGIRALGLVATILVAATAARAERLAVTVYGPNEGLAGDHVRSIVQDARGFLWFATNSGVSRFDGHEFVNYGTAAGLPAPAARKLVEAADGRIYVLSGDTIVRTRSAFDVGGRVFEPLPVSGLDAVLGEATDLARAPDGSLAIAGTRGAFRWVDSGAASRLEPIELGPAPDGPSAELRAIVWAITYDLHGALWAARTYGISRRQAGGAVEAWPLPPGKIVGPAWGWVPSMTTDRSGRVWLLTTGDGVWRLDTEAPEGGNVVARVFSASTGFPSNFVRAVHEGPDGTLWIGTADAGLVRCDPTPDGFRFVSLGTRQGLPDSEVFAIADDDQANLWVGTLNAGVARLASERMSRWSDEDGLRPSAVSALQDDPDGGVLVVMGPVHFASLRDGRVTSWAMTPTTSAAATGWGGQQLLVTDRDGRLWFATGDGAYVYPKGTRPGDLARRKPERILTAREGLSGSEIFRLYVDRGGDVWIGIVHAPKGLCRYRRRDGDVRCFDASDGAPEGAASAFAEDAAGNLWVGCYDGGLFRYRAGRFETWPETAPERQSGVLSIRRDDAGRLWVAGRPGLLRIDAADSDHPSFRRYTSRDGLSDEATAATADDAWGRLYVGSGHGVDRIDLATGAVRSFTTADGLPSNRIGALYRDPSGSIWIGTSRGVARLVPGPDIARHAPRVIITSLRVAGTTRDPRSGPMELRSRDTNVEFWFTAPAFRAGETMRFQTRLIGAGEAWGPPTTHRNVTFANLAPNRYRFEVRAVDAAGLVSPQPAAVAFTIPPPIWRRWWFVAGCALFAAGGTIAVYRARVERLLALERVRTRIATDLHDDIGASLAQIAVLSQLASSRAANGNPETHKALDRITELSGELVDDMGDVVWAINPSRDHVADLAQRIRRFAADLFADAGARLRLDLPESGVEERLDPEVRRQVYLVCKEALHNVARHAKAENVEVSLKAEGRGLVLSVRDDGAGIEPYSGDRRGHGLASMRARAAAIGGTLEIRSPAGGGTELVLRAPVAGVRRLSMWTVPRRGEGS